MFATALYRFFVTNVAEDRWGNCCIGPTELMVFSSVRVCVFSNGDWGLGSTALFLTPVNERVRYTIREELGSRRKGNYAQER